MSSLSTALSLTGVLDSDAAWRLLRTDNTPVIVALLREHLGAEERRLAAEELYERLDSDLDALRGHAFALPQAAQGYCAEWRR